MPWCRAIGNAQMRNVWFLPSVKMLVNWLDRLGFKQIAVIDESNTTLKEQRSTEWMRFHSLQNFLNQDQSKTTEGYPPPRPCHHTLSKIKSAL